MVKIAVAIYGPPGSGKGTQANLLAEKFNLVHLDTGRFLESVVHDSTRQKEKNIRRERKFFDGGQLMTPSFVFREVEKQVRRIATAGYGTVFSGSPRTMYEAEKLIPVLEKIYGRKKLFFILLQVPPAMSLRRNSHRLICRVCDRPLLATYGRLGRLRYCPVCIGSFYRRTLDTPTVIKVRLREYRQRTEPIFGFLKKRGYPLRKINGQPAPAKVFTQINDYFKNIR